jgi:hypothetical protein
MTNIANFRTRSSNKMRKQSAGAAALLASLARGLDQIGQADFKSKEDIQQALFFIALSNAHMRRFIGQIKDDESRARMLAQTNRIEELVEDAGRRAAAL